MVNGWIHLPEKEQRSESRSVLNALRMRMSDKNFDSFDKFLLLFFILGIAGSGIYLLPFVTIYLLIADAEPGIRNLALLSIIILVLLWIRKKMKKKNRTKQENVR